MANDPTLHALITADCKDKLINGVMMVAEALEPVNTSFEKIHVEVNGSALLVPVLKERLGSEEGEGEGLSYGSLSPPGSRSSSPRGTTSSDTVAWWKPQDLRMGLNRQQMPQQNYQPLHNYQKPQANGGSTFSSTDSMCSNSSEHGTLFCPPEAKQQRHEGLWQAGGGSLWPFPSYSYQDPNKTAAPTLPFSQPWSSFVGGDQGVYGAFGASRCVETNYDPLVVQGLGSLVDSLREEVCTLGGWSPVVPQQKVEEDTSVDRLMELLVQPQS